jgi:ABC-type glycerol-3-phosphate transport system permease component
MVKTIGSFGNKFCHTISPCNSLGCGCKLQVDFGPLMAGALISILPILILFLLLQRYFVQGIAFTGTKG